MERDKKMKEICRAAVQLGRMWGIMETLGVNDFPPLDAVQDRDFLIEWATEYVDTGQEDMAEFLEDKMKTVSLIN